MPHTAQTIPKRQLDDQLEAVRSALKDPRWKFRTPMGISRQTHVAADEVRQILDGHPEIARRSVMCGSDGQPLYAAADTGATFREWIERLRWMLAR